MESRSICQKLSSIGVRTINAVQRQQIERFNVHIVEARHFPAFGGEIGNIVQNAHKNLTLDRNVPVYVSIDMDVLEPVSSYCQ
jgi:arginase family enzyme